MSLQFCQQRLAILQEPKPIQNILLDRPRALRHAFMQRFHATGERLRQQPVDRRHLAKELSLLHAECERVLGVPRDEPLITEIQELERQVWMRAIAMNAQQTRMGLLTRDRAEP